MRISTVAGRALALAAVVLVGLYVVVGIVFGGPIGRSVSGVSVAVWVVFGAGTVAATRVFRSAVVQVAATLLTAVAVLDWLGVTLPVPPIVAGTELSASPYTWIAIGVLYTGSLQHRAATGPRQQPDTT